MQVQGGLYFDIDFEVDIEVLLNSLLSDNRVVLQLGDTNPMSLNNSVMAFVPRHPSWLDIMHIMLESFL